MPKLLTLWFGFQLAVDRRTYALTGFGLLGVKYAGDNGLLWAMTGHLVDPLNYLNPVLLMRYPALGSPDTEWMALVLGLWSLPFIWIGVSMTVRRGVNAGWSPWTGLLLLVPVVNYLVMLALCVAPSAPASAVARAKTEPDAPTGPVLRSGVAAVVITLMVALTLTLLSVFILEDYGSALFVGTPFLMGFLSAVIVHRDGYRGKRTTYTNAVVTLVIANGALIIFALEGVICILMATPLTGGLLILGAALGDAVARGAAQPKGPATAMVVALPLLALLPTLAPGSLDIEPVSTTVEINAPPEAVWPRVMAFGPLGPIEHWLFKAGVAAPMGAHIEGEGVGAVRHCEFTTGAFVEPITVWDPPNRLGFDVASQPPSMRELGLWPVVHAPHVEHTMRSHRGEFVLTRLPEGRTRLTGNTWYSLDLAPEPYWRLWSDSVVHLIHARVLEHVARRAEASTSTP